MTDIFPSDLSLKFSTWRRRTAAKSLSLSPLFRWKRKVIEIEGNCLSLIECIAKMKWITIDWFSYVTNSHDRGYTWDQLSFSFFECHFALQCFVDLFHVHSRVTREYVLDLNALVNFSPFSKKSLFVLTISWLAPWTSVWHINGFIIQPWISFIEKAMESSYSLQLASVWKKKNNEDLSKCHVNVKQ